MPLSEDMLMVREYTGEGYLPLVEFGGWRTGVLRYTDEVKPQKLRSMHRHDQTDEVFVLLSGRCIVYLGEGEEKIETIYTQEMQPLKLYNIRQSCWHAYTLTPDAAVLIIENRDTNNENSAKIDLDPLQTEQLTWTALDLWKKPTS